ncbi:peptide chain release factor N(5)-glutamine methyltransferase [Chroococcidiopsis sp. FACHB-1243]|uniref:peptide chain release factor N(5)-glutamine methyltransferase n=1 Tax=Chroococcidiopsis sp. [FACHB-1243] TaxID=2692781 RepID=UPI0017850048|nr:peptide chain release factor N(5)-glutamine methyltransferase [Chroococcidiopsis sp. [FACHB-1243]]MBD2306371.1 peptide chain release factor N(5)-glutamine methyltransferase [Chroococcidiopsis sp. [FACHB-1243]]
MNTSGLELWRWRQQAAIDAIAADVSSKELDWLLQEVAGLDTLSLRLELYKYQPQIQLKLPLAELDRLWQRRLQERLPVQYIAQTTPWRDFKLVVSPAVLIPRPETEILIDLVVEAVNKSFVTGLERGHWVDLGTGSGAIAIGLAAVFPAAEVHAVDLSSAALAVAQSNARNLGYGDRLKFYLGNWWEPLAFLQGQVCGMVSNPPYIPSKLVPQLQPEVANHEPHSALDGGVDGLDCIHHLIATAPNFLRSGGVWLIEMMAGQAETVSELLQQQGSYIDIQIYADLAGIERFALAYRR